LLRIETTNELTFIILSALAPFLCCYYQASKTLSELPDQTVALSEKEILVKIQEFVETAIFQQTTNVHPYCLSLDSISLVLQTLTALQYLTKIKNNEPNSYVYQIKSADLAEMVTTLSHYCDAVPFSYKDFIDINVSSKL
jgi:hypothetical protein